MLAVATYVYVLRQPTVLSSPTLWADDGPIFFKGAIERGLGAIFDPYNGQLFLFQRLVALFAAPLPVAIQPAVYAAVAIAAAVLACSIVLSSRWRSAAPRSARFLCLLALLCSPAVDEVFGTLASAHWWLAIGLLLLGMLSDPLSRRLKNGELAFTALTALTGFAALYALPSLAIRAFRNRSGHSRALLWVAFLGVLVQYGYLLTSARRGNLGGMLADPAINLIAFVRRIFAEAVLGDTNLAVLWPMRMPDWWVWLIPIALVAALIAVWVRAPRLETMALLLALVGGWALALWTMWTLANPQEVLWLYGGRYLLVPMATLYVGLIMWWPKSTSGKATLGLACVLLATGLLSDYHLAPVPPADWAPFAACVEHRTTTCSTVIPPGWPLDVTPPGR